MFWGFSVPPLENPPRGPIVIGTGPVPQASLNGTEIFVDIPRRTVDVRVTLRFNDTEQRYFIYVMSPFRIVSTSVYAIYQHNIYPNEMSPSKPSIGNFSTYYLNAANGSIANATVAINPSFPFYYADVNDLRYELTIGIVIEIRDPLVAVEYPWETSQTVILTFFGDESGVVSDDMYPFMAPSSTLNLECPFIIHLRISGSTYFSQSQPSPIGYYMKEGNRWVMFSIDFIEGRYAQTLLCTSINPVAQANKQIFVFVGGVFVALGSAFMVQSIRYHAERKKEKTVQKTNNQAAEQPSDIRDLIDKVEKGFEKSYLQIMLRNPLVLLYLACNLALFLIIGYLLYLLSTAIPFLATNDIATGITASVALVAALISFLSFGLGVSKFLEMYERPEVMTHYNYNCLKNSLREIDRPILKALIMMKSKHPDLDLGRIDNQALFQRDRLLERLYE
jgi:hypothetical protein